MYFQHLRAWLATRRDFKLNTVTKILQTEVLTNQVCGETCGERSHIHTHVHISCTFITKPIKTNCYTSSPVLHVHDFLYLLQAIHCLNKYICFKLSLSICRGFWSHICRKHRWPFQSRFRCGQENSEALHQILCLGHYSDFTPGTKDHHWGGGVSRFLY